MSSPGQRRGTCGHAMASFDSHLACARFRDEGKVKDPCVKKPDIECAICSSFSPEQRLQLATPSCKIKKEREAKKLESTPSKDTESLVEPSAVTVLGAVDKQGAVKSLPVAPPEKKVKKDKASTSKSVKSTTSSSVVDSKLAQLDEKWSDRFSRLEAILLARSIEPTFSSAVKVTPTHSPPASTSHTTEPFIRPVPAATEFTGTGFSAKKHQPASQTEINRLTTTSMLPGTGFSAVKHQPISKRNPANQLHIYSFLGPAPLLQSISRPVKHRLYDSPLTNLLLPTGHCHLNRLTPAPLLFTNQGEIALPVFLLRPVACCRTTHHWIYTLKKGSYLRIRISP